MNHQELSSDLSQISESAKLFHEIRQELIRLSQSPCEFLCLNVDCEPAETTLKLRASFDLSDSFKEAIVALRAIQPDLLIIKNALHDSRR